MKYEYLADKAFLQNFDKQRLKEQYIKIIILNWDEEPIQDIVGFTTGGSINIDGTSNIRRTANINVFLPSDKNQISNLNTLFSINKKIEIEIGFKNTTKYYLNHNMIWFPMGIYIINQANISHSLNGLNLSLQLKDKICLLNGDAGGILPAAINFSEVETVDWQGKRIISYPTLYQIIQELMHHWGGEQLGKIIIQDLDTRIKKVMKWVGNIPLYCYRTVKNGKSNPIDFTTKESDISSYHLVYKINELKTASKSSYIKYLTGDNIGYIYTDFIYANGELLGNPGDSICTILDRICSLLGNYEYFYDLDGNFIFREIKNYLNTSKSTIDLQEMKNSNYLLDLFDNDSYYNFDDSTLITTYNNNPQFSMIKNDFVVWGEKETIEGKKLPIRYHLVIDKKPQIYNKHKVFQYKDPLDGLLKAKSTLFLKSINDLPRPGRPGIFYFIYGFQNLYVSYDELTWSPIYDDDKPQRNLLGSFDKGVIYYWDPDIQNYVEVPDGHIQEIKSTDWRTELYLQGVDAEPYGIDSNPYYVELQNEWPKLYDIWAKEPDFHKELQNTPSNCEFFLDFIDSTAPISEFSVTNIGRRTKTIVDDKINCLFEPEIPDIVILNRDKKNKEELEKEREECRIKGQEYTQVDGGIYSSISGGGYFNSAYELIKNLLYEYTSYNESISLQTIPIYHLDANTRISVSDPASNIAGDYIIKSISIPLDVSSSMTISAIRAVEKF